jgi:hypothetical protein
MVNVAHQVGGSLGLGVLVTVFASANAQHLAGDAAFAHQVSVALTAGAVMLSAAFALVVAVVGTTLLLPSRPDEPTQEVVTVLSSSGIDDSTCGRAVRSALVR